MRTLTVEKIGETEKAVQYRVTFWIVENPGHPVCWEGLGRGKGQKVSHRTNH